MREKRIIPGLMLLATLFCIEACKKSDTSVNPNLAALNCSGVTFSDTAMSSIAYTGTATVPYEGGNGDLYPTGTSVASTGVTGLSAVIVPGQLKQGSGTVKYTITGTPTVAGTASFAISLGGQSCTLVLPVSPLKATVTALTASVSPATAKKDSAYNGKVTLAYTGGNGGLYPAYSVMSKGVTGLTATLTEGTLATGSGNITYAITGKPASVGTAGFDLSLGGKSVSVAITVSADTTKVK